MQMLVGIYLSNIKDQDIFQFGTGVEISLNILAGKSKEIAINYKLNEGLKNIINLFLNNFIKVI